MQSPSLSGSTCGSSPSTWPGARHALRFFGDSFAIEVGLAAGLLTAFAVSRLAARLLFGISPTDPVAFGATLLVLAAVAPLATLLPARRATAVDPVLVLKQE
jgi:hypothetical protein